MQRAYDHLLTETLIPDGIANRAMRLNMITCRIDVVWLLIMVMELTFILAAHTQHKAVSMYTFFACYVTILTIIA